MCVSVADAQPVPLAVVHGWTSSSEHRAVETLSHTLLKEAGALWQEEAVAGGAGNAALKVLNSRLIAQNLPDMTVLQGSGLAQWAHNGLLYPLTEVAKRQQWNRSLFPAVQSWVEYQGQVVAAPLGIHRINTLLYNRPLFMKAGLAPPKNWAEFEAAVRRLQHMHIRPLAWSDEAWQVATVFDAVLLSEAGPALYERLTVARDGEAWNHHAVELALLRLRWLRSLVSTPNPDKSWSESAKEILNNNAAMLINGDWAKGDLTAWGASPEADFGCAPVPGTQNTHLYSIDTLAMLINPQQRSAAQEKVAEVVFNTPTQLAFNHIKGSVPVRKDLQPQDLRQLDVCARASWNAFASHTTHRIPSFSHRMSLPEPVKNALAHLLVQFITTPAMAVGDAQKRLSVVIRAPSAER